MNNGNAISQSMLLIDGHPHEAALMEAQLRRVNVVAKFHFVSDREEAIEIPAEDRPAPRSPSSHADLPGYEDSP